MNGALDDDLMTISTAVATRQAIIRAPGLPRDFLPGNYVPGDRVVTSDSIRPQYLARRPGTLVRLKLKRWAFRPDDPTPWGRFLHPDGTTGLLPSQFRKETP